VTLNVAGFIKIRGAIGISYVLKKSDPGNGSITNGVEIL
jgi:hypothetical protein